MLDPPAPPTPSRHSRRGWSVVPRLGLLRWAIRSCDPPQLRGQQNVTGTGRIVAYMAPERKALLVGPASLRGRYVYRRPIPPLSSSQGRGGLAGLLRFRVSIVRSVPKRHSKKRCV